MKKHRRLIALMIIALMMFGMLSACSKNEVTHIQDPEDVIVDFDDDEFIDWASELVPLTATPAVFTIPVPAAPGTRANSNQKAVIDYSNTTDGYVMAKYTATTTKELRVIVRGPSGVQYQYRLNHDRQFDVFPLSDGNGSYTITVYEQIDGSRYATVISATASVNLRDEFAPFIRPNQFVNYSANSAVVTRAAELTRGVTDLTGRVSAIYNFIISNFTYDRNFAAEVQRGMHSGYVPDVDAVLSRRQGICFDYAAVMAAMLRSLNIPTRLVVGYAGQAYHAWIDVWSAETGWINNIIYFDGRAWLLMDPTFASTSNQSAEVMRFVGDGSNYSSRFIY